MSIKKFISNPAYSIILFLTIFMFFSFKGCTKESKNPIIEDDNDQTTVFFKDYEDEDIITIETSTGGELSVIGNNVLISVDPENIDPDGIETIIEETGGELVGQFPAIGMYQAEYPFSTENKLMDIINTLNNYSEIEFATYNSIGSFLNTQHPKDYCNRSYDNHKLDVDKNRFFYEIEYYLAVPLMGLVREHMTLSKVKVLVIDSKIAEEITKEFDDVKWIEHTSSADENKFAFAHGTMVAGTIAADNKDGGVNGIASSLINDKLELISAARDTTENGGSVTGIIDLLYKAFDLEYPQICNMSFGWTGRDKNGNEVNNEDTNKLFKKIFEYYPDVLFVVAADNKYYEITNINFAPGGIQLPNVITTAGTKYGDPLQACSWSAYGPLIDIAAPIEKVPVVDPTKTNTVKIVGGNSIGAPAVASLAAILKSINPNLSPGEIKQYILDNSSSTATSVSGRRLVLPQPIEQLLIDMPAPDEILKKIDITDGPDFKWDLPGVVAARICDISTIKIDGEPIMECETSDTSNGGYITSARGGLIIFTIDTQFLEITFWNKYKILNTDLEIIEYYPGIQDAIVVGYANSDINHMVSGTSVSGTISIKNGIITERYPGTGHPMVIEAEGVMSGVMKMVVVPDDINPIDAYFSGTLQIFLVLWEGESDDFYEYFENNCD